MKVGVGGAGWFPDSERSIEMFRPDLVPILESSNNERRVLKCKHGKAIPYIRRACRFSRTYLQFMRNASMCVGAIYISTPQI